MAQTDADSEKALSRYAYDLCKLHGLGRPAHWMTLLAIARASVAGRPVAADTAFRAALMARIGCGPSWVGSALADCVRAGLLMRDAAGQYALAQNFFGDWCSATARPTVLPRLVMVVAYGPDGRQLLSAGPVSADVVGQSKASLERWSPLSIGAPGGSMAG